MIDIDPATDWQLGALCAQSDPEAWFPEKGGSTMEAKRVCGHCEVWAECLLGALDRREPYGVWGGLSERQRTRLTAAEREALTAHLTAHLTASRADLTADHMRPHEREVVAA